MYKLCTGYEQNVKKEEEERRLSALFMFYVLYSSLLCGGGVHTELGLKMLVDLLTFGRRLSSVFVISRLINHTFYLRVNSHSLLSSSKHNSIT